MARKEPMDRTEAEEKALFGKAVPNVFNGRILVRPQGFEDGIRVCIDPGGAPISTKSARPGIALFTLSLAPTADAGRADPKTLSRSPM